MLIHKGPITRPKKAVSCDCLSRAWKSFNRSYIAFCNFLQHNNMEKWACQLSYYLYQPHGCWWGWSSSVMATFIGPKESAGTWKARIDPSAQLPPPAFWLRSTRSQVTRVWFASQAKQDREARQGEESGMLVLSIREPGGRERGDASSDKPHQMQLGCGTDGAGRHWVRNCLCVSISVQLWIRKTVQNHHPEHWAKGNPSPVYW